MGPGGLLSGLSLRIALHSGPVYKFTDPVTGDRSYGGTHVSRTARMEPITRQDRCTLVKRSPLWRCSRTAVFQP
jgi:hypothetical protein